MSARRQREANRHLADVALKMELLLSRLTVAHEGKPPSEIKPLLRAAFEKEGWGISGRELTQWATMISRGEKINVFWDPV